MYLFHAKMAHAHPNRFLCLVGFLVFYFYPYIYIYIHIYICICSTLRWHMPTQTVFSASWGSWYSFFIHTYIYICVYLFHTKMAHAHPNRFLCLVGFLVFYVYPFIYIYIYIYIYICICSTLRWHMPTQTVFSASWGAWYSIFIHIYICICSTLRWRRKPSQTVFSASWGSLSIYCHIYIYIYVSVPH